MMVPLDATAQLVETYVPLIALAPAAVPVIVNGQLPGTFGVKEIDTSDP